MCSSRAVWWQWQVYPLMPDCLPYRVHRHLCVTHPSRCKFTMSPARHATSVRRLQKCRCLAVLQVALDVWYPASLALTAADTTLNSVLPINAAPSTPVCASYQSTPLRLTATFSNGGTAATDTIVGADVTSLATFASNDTNVAQVFGAMAKVSSPNVMVPTPAGTLCA